MIEHEERAIIQRIFSRAAMKLGSAAHLAEALGVSYAELQGYLHGSGVPSDAVLFRAVDVILDELPAIRATFSERAWTALSLPTG